MDKVTALVIPTGDEPAYLTRLTPDLATLQGLVGGYIEPLTISPDAVMFLNEEGKYAGLPVNGGANRVVALADVGLHSDDFIVGQVVIVGVLNAEGREDGDTYDVPESGVDLCRRGGVVVEDRTGSAGESPRNEA